MIIRWYEVSCDICGCAEHYRGSIESAESQFRGDGGIVTKDKKYFCSKECYAKRIKSNES